MEGVCILSGGVLIFMAVTWMLYTIMKAPLAEATILELLEYGPSYGLDLVNNSGGRLHRGTVYVHLHRLEERGVIRSWEDDRTEVMVQRGQLPRRMYELVR